MRPVHDWMVEPSRDAPSTSTGTCGPSPVITGTGSGVTERPEHMTEYDAARVPPYAGPRRTWSRTAAVAWASVGHFK